MIKVDLSKVQLPVTSAYFTLVSKLVPGRQALLQHVEWYSAGQDRRYAAGVHLLTRDLVISDLLKDKLRATVGDDAVVLVGDLRLEADKSCTIERRVINDIVQHMEKRDLLLRKRGIIIGNDGRYPSLINNHSLFHEARRGFPRQYNDKRDVKIILAIDATNPRVLTSAESGRFMSYAIDTAEELLFQQQFFFKNDRLSVVVFGESPNDITEDYQRLRSWKVNCPRNTARCLEHCIKDISQGNGYRHIYLVTTGSSNDRNICDIASRIREKGFGLSQFVVGEDWKEIPNSLAQFLQIAQDSSGDLYLLKQANADILSLIINEHFERYRAGVK